jgi:hypothetical protein
LQDGITDQNISLEEGTELNTVTVVGSRNLSRTRVETPVPVDLRLAKKENYIPLGDIAHIDIVDFSTAVGFRTKLVNWNMDISNILFSVNPALLRL